MVHVVHQTPEGAPVFTPGEEVGKEFEELEAKEGEKVGLGLCVWLVVRWKADNGDRL